MKSHLLLIALLFVFFKSLDAFPQDTLLTDVAKKNKTTLSMNGKTFQGKGWDVLIDKIQSSDYVLIGEDHFTNEIPFFVSAITTKIKFDNFFCEIDPFSAKIIEGKLKTLSENQLKQYEEELGMTFSFYALAPEFQLMKDFVKAKTAIYGTDQILLVADRLVCNELAQKTKNSRAKEIYKDIAENSRISFSRFLKEQKGDFYLLTDNFQKQITELLSLNLRKEEREIVLALQLTATIYKEQRHHLRIQLMKNNLMNVYQDWKDKKNLFKFGANHLPKGESLLKIYDLGNLVNNIADSQFKKSMHIMIVGKSGMQSSPFKGFEEQLVDENSESLKSLKPLFKAVSTDDWHCFDLLPIRTEVEKGAIKVNDLELYRIIMGYDYVVIIPKVTAAKFLETK